MTDHIAASDPDPAGAPPRRVVIAEDEALIRLDLAEMLRDEGYQVVGEAGDGQEAVDLAESLRPDLVIMDVKMPRRDGIDAAAEIAVKPFSISDLIPAIEVALSRFAEITELEREVADLGERLETRKLVERAKGLLQARHAMTEPEAFSWMQRAAMDRRTSMKRVAEVVLESFDGPSRDPSAR